MTTVAAAPARTERERLARRRREIARLNGLVQAVLRAFAQRRWPAGRWGTTLTVYDRLLGPDDARGGHWTLFCLDDGPCCQSVESYVVTLRFGARDEASAFELNGERTVWIAGALPATLATVLATLPPLRQRIGAGAPTAVTSARR